MSVEEYNHRNVLCRKTDNGQGIVCHGHGMILTPTTPIIAPNPPWSQPHLLSDEISYVNSEVTTDSELPRNRFFIATDKL